MQDMEIISSTGKFDPEAETAAVFYHRNCADGSCSAGLHAAMKRSAYAAGGSPDNTIYCPAAYGTERAAADGLIDAMERHGIQKLSELWVVDFHFEPGLMEEICLKAGGPRKIVYLDHHKTSRGDLEVFRELAAAGLPGTCAEVRFGGSSEAGAGMTYDYIVRECGSAEKAFSTGPADAHEHVGELVRTCVDYDLWTHSDPDTMPIVTGIMAAPLPVSKWADMLLNYGTVRADFLNRGKGIIDQQEHIARSLAESLDMPVLEYEGTRVALLNIPHQWVNIVSHKLLELAGEGNLDAVLSYSVSGADQHVSVSVRAGRSRRLDCGEFTKEWFGGGGHTGAAGGRCTGMGEYMAVIEKIRECSGKIRAGQEI